MPVTYYRKFQRKVLIEEEVNSNEILKRILEEEIKMTSKEL